jgi:hypothetical protein
MKRPPPKLEVFFCRHGEAWRAYVNGWTAPYIRSKLDANGEAWPVLQRCSQSFANQPNTVL